MLVLKIGRLSPIFWCNDVCLTKNIPNKNNVLVY